MSVKPKLIDSFNKMFSHLKKLGLHQNDIVLLLQRRTNPRVSIKDIRATIEAIKAFEKQIDRMNQPKLGGMTDLRSSD